MRNRSAVDAHACRGADKRTDLRSEDERTLWEHPPVQRLNPEGIASQVETLLKGVDQGYGEHTPQLGKRRHPELCPEVRDNLSVAARSYPQLVALYDATIVINFAVEHA